MISYYELTESEQKDVLERVIEKENAQGEVDDILAESDFDDYAVEDYILDEYMEDVNEITEELYGGAYRKEAESLEQDFWYDYSRFKSQQY